jgi:type I restriction enzyme S subunit
MKKGWQTKKLSEFYQIGSSKRVLKSQWKAEGVPFYRGREVTRLAADGFVENELFVSEKHFAELAKQYGVPKAGDIVITAIGTIGNSHVVRDSDRFYFKDASVLWMKRVTDISSEFINFWLKSPHFFDQLDRGNGATVDTLTIQKLQSVGLLIPPLPEQRRIVGILDEAFAGLATAKANAAKNLHNARALFDSHLQSVFSQRGKGWVETTLGEIAEFKNGLNYNKNSNGQTLPVVGVANFQDNYYVPHSDLDTATIDGNLAENYSIQKNDILTVRSNGSKHLVGRCMLVGDIHEMVSYSGFIIRIRYNTAKLYPEYFLHFMKCQATRDALTQGGGGANITNINQEKLSSLPVPFPLFPEQKKIATELDALREETNRLAAIYQQKLAALEALKKSLLHQAFSGEL